jgi:hypothetical protein
MLDSRYQALMDKEMKGDVMSRLQDGEDRPLRRKDVQDLCILVHIYAGRRPKYGRDRQLRSGLSFVPM